ncbi:MAG: hypothetical protein ACI4DT_02635, partial [Chordicoccus sp.]
RPFRVFRLANECYNTSVFRPRQQEIDIFSRFLVFNTFSAISAILSATNHYAEALIQRISA